MLGQPGALMAGELAVTIVSFPALARLRDSSQREDGRPDVNPRRAEGAPTRSLGNLQPLVVELLATLNTTRRCSLLRIPIGASSLQSSGTWFVEKVRIRTELPSTVKGSGCQSHEGTACYPNTSPTSSVQQYDKTGPSRPNEWWL